MAAVLQSAVRLPSPEAEDAAQSIPRKRSPSSRSPSPRRQAPPLRRRSLSRSPPRRDGPLPRDVDRSRAMERQRQMEMRQKEEVEATAKPLSAAEKQAAAKAEYERLLNMRSGGTYVPPARLRALQAEIGTDPQSKEYQRMAWEALKKSINGLINKVNVSNIKFIVPELFGENLVRGRGLFCRSIMKAQAASLPFTPIYAAMVAIVNTKLPQVGELLVNRLIVQFRKAFKRNDKNVCLSSTTFLAHLINQQVAHEMLAAQILLLLLNKPTDDSVEIAVGLMKEVGQHLEEFNTQISLAVFDQFRSILHEADIDKRTQYMIEVLFQIRKDKYKDNPAIKEELDLVEEEDQITHNPGLDDQIDVQDGLNIFKFDSEYEENENAYKKLKAEILGEAEDSDEDEDASDASSSDDEEDVKEREMEIKDQSNTDLVNLRRTIYLTIMSSGGFEECTHKLLRINLPAGLEHEMPSMIIECCSQERTYNKFFGLIGERLCKLNRMWAGLFEEAFVKYYETIHRYETNRLRIIAQFFGHLLSSDAVSWHCLSCVHLNEDETTSSSRIFIKILIEDLAQGIASTSSPQSAWVFSQKACASISRTCQNPHLPLSRQPGRQAEARACPVTRATQATAVARVRHHRVVVEQGRTPRRAHHHARAAVVEATPALSPQHAVAAPTPNLSRAPHSQQMVPAAALAASHAPHLHLAGAGGHLPTQSPALHHVVAVARAIPARGRQRPVVDVIAALVIRVPRRQKGGRILGRLVRRGKVVSPAIRRRGRRRRRLGGRGEMMIREVRSQRRREGGRSRGVRCRLGGGEILVQCRGRVRLESRGW
ncbi:pre-mRNA-splicing factor cwc22 [Zalaria obscura]|uniref:Pre-mRNA-splicing factor cwc22 n=1 Tax=Zalaria obscura TaxID=2024903 RepID=A0ACC3S8U0_9PEZI